MRELRARANPLRTSSEMLARSSAAIGVPRFRPAASTAADTTQMAVIIQWV